MKYPERIVCLTEETAEALYRMGLQDRVVGVSGFAVRPKGIRDKPRISTFLDADVERLLALTPDLVLAFSDLQADIVSQLVRRGLSVHVFNQRSIEEILQAMRLVGALVGEGARGEALADALSANVEKVRAQASALPRRPRVFFEEWHEPLIAGIAWVSELVEVAGGDDICAALRVQQGAKGRIVAAEDIAARDPEVVIASWCGKKAQREKIIARPGWQAVSAVRDTQLYEIKSSEILQPGPAALTDGLAQLHAIIAAVSRGERLPEKRPGDLRRAPFTPYWPT